MRHPKKLREEVDFYVLTKSASIRTPNGLRTTEKIWKIWLVQENGEAFICPTCFQFTGPHARNVFAHRRVHTTKTPPLSEVYRQAAAFRLMPEKIQKLMLKRLDEQGEQNDRQDD